jgi:hypothetical protein
MTRPATSTTARAESGSGRAAPCTKARHFCIVPASSTAMSLKPQCCPKEPARKIPRDIHEHARDVARSFAGTEGFEQSQRERKKIEMRFAHLKRILKLGRLRLRGPRAAQRSLFWPLSLRTCAGSHRWFRDRHRSGSVHCVVSKLRRAARSADQSRPPLTGWPPTLGRSRLLQQNLPGRDIRSRTEKPYQASEPEPIDESKSNSGGSRGQQESGAKHQHSETGPIRLDPKAASWSLRFQGVAGSPGAKAPSTT